MLETFTEYRARKALERLLVESPAIVHTDTHEVIKATAKTLIDYVKLNHKKSIEIEKDFYKLDYHSTSSIIYYHYVNSNPREISFISNNIQVGVMKNGGTVDYVYKFMKYHIEHHGVLKSSNSNTDGSKNMWINFIKHNQQYKFLVINTSNKNSYEINVSNIEIHKNEIWGDDTNKFAHIIIHANTR